MGLIPLAFKLVIFDLDGVLVPIESSWQYIHNNFGRSNEESYKRYMRGLIDFSEFMRSDVALWNGATKEEILKILDRVQLTRGAHEVVKTLREMGVRTVILSSGISFLADRVGQELGIDRVYANRLIADSNGRLNGEGEAIVPLREKHRVIQRILDEEKVSAKECVVVGDNVFDIPRFGDVGLSIAFNSRNSGSTTKADVSIPGGDLRSILSWLTSESPNKIVIRLATTIREAKTIAIALTPDNIKMPQGLYIAVSQENRNVCVKIVSVRGLSTLLATINDVLSCCQMAISSINIAKSIRVTKTI
ncbi:HAD-IB family phosphatase [Candidatus Bathyarchaeota archaeon]|nr:HAD-IB family phosphatase [Candidatus Bathyarchaeota archaeon]